MARTYYPIHNPGDKDQAIEKYSGNFFEIRWKGLPLPAP